MAFDFKRPQKTDPLLAAILQSRIDATKSSAAIPSGFQPQGIQTPPEAPTPPPVEFQPDEPKQPTKVITDEKGRMVGVETSSGRTLTGLNPSDVRGLVEKEARRGGEIVGAEEFAREEAQRKAVEAEQQRVFEEEQPTRRELDPARTLLEKTPILGGTLGALANIMADILPGKAEKAVGRQLTPDELRTTALTEIEKQEVEKGLTASEKFGELVEGIPVVGSLASKYAGGLIETPSENTQTILKELKTEKTRATNVEIKVKDGTLPTSAGLEMINDIDLNIQRMESRIKLLVSRSPELKFNSDGVNFIETKILEARERLFNAKINIVAGASQNPSDIQILTSLKGQLEAEDFTIPNR